MMHARTRDGSLRQAAADAGATVLLFEGGEAWRFDEDAIAIATAGVKRVLHHLGMVEELPPAPEAETSVSRSSRWVRARRAGIASLEVRLGDCVAKGAPVAVIRDSFGNRLSRINAPLAGVVIGHVQRPLVNRGDAIVHIAELT
jgi:predicted deacylase